MTHSTLMVGEIEVTVTGFFTTHHYLETEAGTLGKLTFPAFSQYGTLRLANERELLMQKTHWLGSAHELIEGDVVRGTADRAGLFRQDYAVQFDGQEYGLEPAGLLSQGWYLVDAARNRLLEVQPRGAFKQGAILTIWGALDLDLAAFVYYLVHMRWQENAAVVAATAAS